MERRNWRWRDGLSCKGCSPMNIPWEFTLNCFWFVYFFQYTALAHTPSVPALTPRVPPPRPTHPPAHATLSSPSPTLSQVVLRCPSNAAMKDHYKLLEPVNKSSPALCFILFSPWWTRWWSLMWRSRWISNQTCFQAPFERHYLLPKQMYSNSERIQRKHVV